MLYTQHGTITVPCTQLFLVWQTVIILYYSNTKSTVVRNLTVLSSTTDKINRISYHFLDWWRHQYVVNLRGFKQPTTYHRPPTNQPTDHRPRIYQPPIKSIDHRATDHRPVGDLRTRKKFKFIFGITLNKEFLKLCSASYTCIICCCMLMCVFQPTVFFVISR